MELLHAVAAGVSGAENGSVDIWKRGTATRAPLYGDFEGTTSLSAATQNLDSNGRAVIYVNEYVDIQAYDADGLAVGAKFTVGNSAPLVEVRSQSFTGTDYTTGEQAAGYPVDLKTVLDRLKTSFGSVDFKVLFGGSSVNLQTALASLTLGWYNVKSAEYGATGDGVTDDTASIQAAIDAASAADGGIVFFPGGTYKLTSSLTLGAKVELLGSGAGSSLLVQSTSDEALTCDAAGAYHQAVDGLTISRTATSANALVLVDDTSVRFLGCLFSDDDASKAQLYVDPAGDCDVLVGQCHFSVHNAQQVAIEAIGANVRATIFGNTFDNLDATMSKENIYAANGATVMNTFLMGNVTGGTVGVIKSTQVVALNTATAAGGALPDAVALMGDVSYEVGNSVANTNQALSSLAGASTATTQSGLMLSRCGRQVTVDDNSATVEVDSVNYETCQIVRTDGTALVVEGQVCPAGNELFVVIHNDWGSSSGNITFDTDDFWATSPGEPFTVAANSYKIFWFKSVAVNGDIKWMYMAASTAHSEP